MSFFKRINHLIAGNRLTYLAKIPSKVLIDTQNKAKGLWKKMGPGFITGAADDDPSGIATYSQAGAQFGLNMAFMAFITYPLMSVVQEMCARIGIVTNKGLAANIRLHFPKPILIFVTVLLFIANTFNIGANLGAMAEATRLIMPNLSFVILLVFFTVGSLLLQIFTSYKTYSKYLKWLALSLFAYILTAFTINLNWTEIFSKTIYPSFVVNKESILMVAAILGTTISPYLFFWQTSQEVEEKILKSGNDEQIENSEVTIYNAGKQELQDMKVDVWSGMFISNIVMFFIIIVCASTLHISGISDIKSAADAAKALEPLVGQFSSLLFAIGIVGTGLLAVPVLAGSTSYAMAESFRWVSGLHYKLREAYAFYGVIILSMVVGFILNFIGLDPIHALIYSAVINCIVAPIVLIFIVIISSRKKIMGNNVNSITQKTIGWSVVLIMFMVSIATVFAILN